MEIKIVPESAIKLMDEADKEGVAYSLTRSESPRGTAHLRLGSFQNPDWIGPDVLIELRPDGTWSAILDGYISPGGMV